MDELVLPFRKLNKNSTRIAGGKGAQLGEMFNAGIPVPDGFVVLTSAFNQFIQENEIGMQISKELSKADQSDMLSIENASNQIRQRILSGIVSKNIRQKVLESFKQLNTELVAVRSSATSEDAAAASWAGELESYTNTSQKDLIENVKKCWSSLYTPRAIFYRLEHQMRNEQVSVAVVVQKMVNSEASGVVFTVNPVTKNPNQIVIEAAFGLGESVVSGKVTPDNYMVNKKSELIENVSIGRQLTQIVKEKGKSVEKKLAIELQEKQKLEGKKILEVARVCMAIETHYQKPQDIEFAIEKGKVYVVQSRPITTLGN
ncbi:MAG: PEP/pyruvate-binding domain-containing protein [Candidatus Diapherotrites archaeon]